MHLGIKQYNAVGNKFYMFLVTILFTITTTISTTNLLKLFLLS